MEAQKCKPISTLFDGQRVWRSLKIVDNKCSHISCLRMWLLGSYDTKMARTTRFFPSWDMVRLCWYTSAPFVIWVYLGSGCFQDTYSRLESQPKQQNVNDLMSQSIEIINYSHCPLYHVKEIFCYLLSPFVLGYKILWKIKYGWFQSKKKKRNNYHLTVTCTYNKIKGIMGGTVLDPSFHHRRHVTKVT